MSQLFDNNYWETISPTGRDIQGIVPVKKYYVLKQPFKQATNTKVLSIPILYRESTQDHSNQYLYIDVYRTGGGLLQPFLVNATNYDLNFIAIIEQQFNNTIQQKNYLQRDNAYTTVKSGQQSNSFMTLQSWGSSTDSSNGGNDKGTFNLNIVINNHNFNLVGSWYCPLVTSLSDTNNQPLNGWVTLENIDDFINLV